MSAIAEPPPIALKLPSLPGAPKTPPAQQDAPKAQETPAAPAPAAPANPLADTPPEGKSIAGIPTDIHSDQAPQKPVAKIIEERQKAKEDRWKEKLGVDDIQKQRDEALQKEASAVVELETLRRQHEEQARQLEEFRGTAEARKTEIEKVTGQYFDQFKAEVNPAEDPEFSGAYNQFHTAMVAGLPEIIPTAAGERPFIPEAFLNNPANSQQVGNIMAHYAAARGKGDAATMQMAVTALAQLMGANFVASPDPEVAVLVDPGSPLYQQISTAMKSGLPHFQQMNSRGQLLREEAPKIVAEKIQGRTLSIKSNLEKGIFIPIEEATERLVQNPTDSAALISALIHENPELKEDFQQSIAGLAPAFARMGQLQMPTLASNKPEDIQAHQREVRHYQEVLGGAMKDAVMGRSAGRLISSLYAQLRAATARADGASVNTNPGRGTDGGPGTAPALKAPPTEI